jgi:cytidylate kinase
VARSQADEAQVRKEQKDTDDARESYGRTFYRVTQNDPMLYHLIIDSTVFSLDTCIDLVLRAASDRLGMHEPRSTS